MGWLNPSAISWSSFTSTAPTGTSPRCAANCASSSARCIQYSSLGCMIDFAKYVVDFFRKIIDQAAAVLTDGVMLRLRDSIGRVLIDPFCKAIEIAFEKLLRARVGDASRLVDRIFLECEIHLRRAEQRHVLRHDDAAQMRLCRRRPHCPWRAADNADRLARPRILTPRARAPVDGVFDDGRDRAVVLGRYEQHRLRRSDIFLHLQHASRR